MLQMDMIEAQYRTGKVEFGSERDDKLIEEQR